MNRSGWSRPLRVGGATLTAALAGVAASAAAPVVDGPWQDHAVFQRDRPITLSGTSDGEVVRVHLANRRSSVDVAEDGTWQVSFRAMKAGGPHRLTIEDETGSAAYADLYAGDVWLCSGQSNMEHPVYRALNPDREIAGPHSETMRLLTIPHAAEAAPSATLPDGARWQVASAASVRDFSAVCLFAAQDYLAARDRDVPLGLIDSSWGGSQIEAWLPKEALRAAGDYADRLSLLGVYVEDPDEAMAAFGDRWEEWWREARAGSEPWRPDSEAIAWKPVPEDLVDWQTYGTEGTDGHLGHVWYRKTFTLTQAQAEAAAALSLGRIDEVDVAWMNGDFVASTFGWGTKRTYDLSGGMAEAGENTIVVNVFNGWGQGGMLGPAEDVGLRLMDGTTVPLGEDWEYAVVEGLDSASPRMPWESVGGFTTIHNGMIVPLGHYAMAAAVWYQGESNAGKPETYASLLDGLIGSWRERFGEDLPVVVVQLPGFGAMPTSPQDSGWSRLREAQRQVAVDDPLTGLAVIMDAGDRTDIHPPNKQLVGSRVAAVLDALTSQDATGADADGAAAKTARREGNSVVVSHNADDLRAVSAADPIGFELCDTEGTCRWADADLAGGDTVTLATDGPDGTAASVRFCWGDAPICNLVRSDGTPVAPFEIAIDGSGSD